MNKEKIPLPALNLVGLTTRTNNQNEMNPDSSKMIATITAYREQQVADKIVHRVCPGVTYACYTDYESNEKGDYTYFIGEVVDSLDNQNLSQLTAIRIPAGIYQKFTTPPGKMPAVVVTAWQKIWTMTDDDLGGKRIYSTDFEVYDQRAADPDNSIVDIYISI